MSKMRPLPLNGIYMPPPEADPFWLQAVKIALQTALFGAFLTSIFAGAVFYFTAMGIPLE